MEVTAKEKMKFSFDINADAIRFFIDVQWTVGEAKNTTCGRQTKINSQKVEGTMLCNVVIGPAFPNFLWPCTPSAFGYMGMYP